MYICASDSSESGTTTCNPVQRFVAVNETMFLLDYKRGTSTI